MKLRYTLRAAAELDKVLGYIGERSPQGADRVKVRIKSLIDLLLLFPDCGTPMPGGRLRRMVAHPHPYLIFYRATEDENVIHGIRPAARRPSSMSE